MFFINSERRGGGKAIPKRIQQDSHAEAHLRLDEGEATGNSLEQKNLDFFKDQCQFFLRELARINEALDRTKGFSQRRCEVL